MTNPESSAIEVRGLAKIFKPSRFGRAPVIAIDGCDLAVPTGSFCGLLGKNGAGKSTLLRLLAGLLKPSRGHAHVLGFDMWTATSTERMQVAYVPQHQQLHGGLTLSEHCSYLQSFYDAWDGDHASRLATTFELPQDAALGTLSGGQQRKASILLALAGRPRVLLLDEPAIGLDPIARRVLMDELIDALAATEAVTVLFSTHLLSDLERLADRVAVMREGRVAIDETLDDMRQRVTQLQLIFPTVEAASRFTVTGAYQQSSIGRVVALTIAAAATPDLIRLAEAQGAECEAFPVSLEDAFICLSRTWDHDRGRAAQEVAA
ncbi:MAG: ABC transporter ATP-binding protein [bacterium]